MFTEEEKKWAYFFRDLMEIMEKAPRQEPPEGFTARVMERLPKREGGRPEIFVLEIVLDPGPGNLHKPQPPTPRDEVGMCFLLLPDGVFLSSPGIRSFSGDKRPLRQCHRFVLAPGATVHRVFSRPLVFQERG